MGCWAIARTDQQLVIGNLQDVLNSIGIQNAIKDWLQSKLAYPVELRAITQGQNIRYYAGTTWLNITPFDATLTGPRAVELKPEFEKFMKELLASIKIFQTVAVLQKKAAILSDKPDAKTGHRVIELQL